MMTTNGQTPKSGLVVAAATAAVSFMAAVAAPSRAHPGPRVWIGSSGGSLATYTSNNDLNPGTFALSRVFIGGVDEETLTANGRLDEYPVPGTGIFASEFPGYQVRTDGQSGLSFGSSLGFNIPSPLLVFEPASLSFKPSRQVYGTPGPAPQMNVATGASSFTTASSLVPGTQFLNYNSSGDHAHLVSTLLGNGTQAVDGPHAVYALPMQLTGAGMAASLPYYILFGRDIDSSAPVFQNAITAANAAVASSGGTWIADANGDWETPGNWFANSPNSAGATATFGGAISAPRTVSLSSARTVGRMVFNSAHSYTISGSGSLTIDAISGSGNLTSDAGSHTIGVPVHLADNTSVAVFGPTATLSINAPLTAAAGVTLSMSGTGNLSVRNLRLAGVSVGRGTISIQPDGTPAGASRIAGPLTIAGGSTPTATLDLGDNDLMVTSASLSTVRDQIVFARNGGAWDGNGITSNAARSHAQSATTLGLLSGSDYLAVNGTDFSGFTVAATDVLVKYTWYGDCDFNGIVDFDDYVRTDNGFNTSAAGWANGDFDLSGLVDFDDYVLIDLGFNTQTGTLRRVQSFLDGSDRRTHEMTSAAERKVLRHFERFGLDYATAFLAAVPEPAGTTILTSATMLVLGGRRRHRTSV